MISHKYQCIFIHIPKCAGTSIERAFGHFDCHTGRGGQDHRSIRMIEKPILSVKTLSSKENMIDLARRIRNQHRTVLNQNNKLTVTKKQYNKYFKFTVIRNPWERAFSWYKNVMRDEVHKKNDSITKELSLTEFLQEFAGRGMLKPQTYWLKNFKGEMPFNFIIRFEHLSEEFNKVTKLMNVPQIALPHEVKGTNLVFQEHYTEESIKIIETIYKEEIEMFDYSFFS